MKTINTEMLARVLMSLELRDKGPALSLGSPAALPHSKKGNSKTSQYCMLHLHASIRKTVDCCLVDTLFLEMRENNRILGNGM